MGKLLLLSRNRADEAILTPLGQSWQVPLDNLKTRVLAEVARSADVEVANTSFDIDLAARRAIRGLVLPNNNLTTRARYRVQGNIVKSFDEPRYDSGWQDAYRRLFTWRELRWGDPNFWFGRAAEEDLEGFTRSLIHVLPETIDAAYWRVEIDDQSNPAGFVDIGRLFIAGGAQPSHNYSYGGALGFESATRVDTSRTGTKFFDRREPRRVMRFALEYLPEQEALERWLEIQRRMGLDGEVFVIPDPDDDQNLTRRSFLGTLRALSAWEQVSFQRASIAFEIEEIL